MGFVENELVALDWSFAWDCDTWDSALGLFLGSWVWWRPTGWTKLK